MRILAIRGENIASLKKFAIDFTQAPLRDAGIFAITGPTGAGKSSLLDALCLALFAKAPRLDHVSAQSGELDSALGTLKMNAAENLIRRGCATAHAEVDFAGADGLSYQARWSYRAGKRKGAASQLELTLLCLENGQVLVQGPKISEYLAEVQKRLGWTYEQFTRAVLLAQGRFAEFLKASDNDRAELLEKLTGTDIYRRISEWIFRRAQSEAQSLAQLKAQAQGQAPLPPEARNELESRLSTVRQTLHTQTREEQEWRELSQLLRQCDQGTQQLQGLSASLSSCLEAGSQTKSDFAQAEQALRQAKQSCETLEPQIRAAESLDQLLALRSEEHAAKEKGFAQLSNRLQALQAEQQSAQQKAQAQQKQLDDQQCWLAAHPDSGRLSTHWTLAQHLLRSLAELEQKNRQSAQSQDLLRAQVLHTAQEQEQYAQSAASLLQACGSESPESVQKSLLLARQAGQELEQGIAYQNLAREVALTAQRIAEIQAAGVPARQHVAVCQASEVATRQSYERIQQAHSQSVEALRATLQPDCPCPVCGALAHPYAQSDSLFRQLHQEQQAAWQTAKDALVQAQREVSTLEARLAGETQTHREQSQKLSVLPSPASSWLAMLTAAESDWEPWCSAQRAAQQTQIQTLEKRYNDSHAAQTAQAAALAAQERHASAQKALAALQAQHTDIVNQQHEMRTQLSTLLSPDWQQQWESAGERYTQQLASLVQDYLGRQQSSDSLQSSLASLQVQITGLAAQIEERTQELALLQSDFQQKSDELQALRNERQELLQGQPWKQVQSAARQALQSAESEFVRVQATLEKFREQYRDLQSREKAQQELLAHATSQLAQSALYNNSAFAQLDHAAAIAQSSHALASLTSVIQENRKNEAQLHMELGNDDQRRSRQSDLLQKALLQEEQSRNWNQLSGLIGSADGKAFRKIAQQFTLEQLLAHSNTQLANITPRYRLESLPGSMNFCISDSESYGEKRPVHTLSGGETFIVSLALALGLAQMAAGTLQVESLFIDEGFGTLDPETLRSVMAALSSLQAQGRKVGLITHVEEMKHQIPVRIEVLKMGQGASQVRVVG